MRHIFRPWHPRGEAGRNIPARSAMGDSAKETTDCQLVWHAGFGSALGLLTGLFVILALPILWTEGLTPSALGWTILLGAALVWLSAFDIRTLRLPDAVTLPLMAAGLLATWLADGSAAWSFVSALFGFGLLVLVAAAYRAWRGYDGLGLGDAKLLAAAGAWLGAESLASVLIWACGFAILAVVTVRCAGVEMSWTTRIPFGPFLALGTWIVWLYGPLVA